VTAGLVRPGQWVGVLGLGRTFHDVLPALTTGRGGRFHQQGDRLAYARSGDEPFIVAGSRSGVPFRARVQGSARRTGTGLLSRDALAGGRPPDFARDVWPLLCWDVQLAHDVALLGRRRDRAAGERFRASFLAAARAGAETEVVRAAFGIGDVPPLDLGQLVDPFRDAEFAGPNDFRDRLLELLRADLRDAAGDKPDDPVRAALDVLCDARATLRGAVDFPPWFDALCRRLSGGPPVTRIAEIVALIEAGVLWVCGPRTRSTVDAGTTRLALESPRVAGSHWEVDVLVDARVHSSY
jgi:hypothetical protein